MAHAIPTIPEMMTKAKMPADMLLLSRVDVDN